MNPQRKISLTLIFSTILLGFLSWLLPSPNNLKLDREIFWITKTFTSKKYNIIIAGDSRAYRGLSPEDMITPISGDYNAINLGYSSGGFDRSYRSFLLSKLNTESNLKVLILGVTPHSLTKDGLENGHFHEILATPYIDRLKTLYLSPVTGFFEPRPFKSVSRVFKSSNSKNYEKFHSNGWAESDHLDGDSLKALENYAKVFKGNTVLQSVVDDLMIWVDSLSKQGVSIIGFRPPSTVKMRALEDSLSGYHESAIKEAFKSNGGKWIEFKDNDFASYDGSHLRAKDARELSREIGLEINLLLK
jgi:hypothetical protein